MKMSNSICCLCAFVGGASYIDASQSSSSVVSSAVLSVPTRSYFTSSSHHRQLDTEQLGVSLQPIDNESPIAERALRESQTHSESQETRSGLTCHKFDQLENLVYTFGDFKGFKKLFDQLKPYKGSGGVTDPYCWRLQNSLQEEALALACLYANAAGPWRSNEAPSTLSFKQAIEQLSKQIGRVGHATDLRQYILFVFWVNDNGEKISNVLQRFREVVLSDLVNSWIEKIVNIIKDQSARKLSQDAKENKKVKDVSDPADWVTCLEHELDEVAQVYERDMGVSKLSQERLNKPSFSSSLLLELASELHKTALTYSSDTGIAEWFELLHTTIIRCQKLSSFGFRGDSAENSLRSGGESPRSMPSLQVNDEHALSPFGGSLRSFGTNSDGSPQSPHRILALSPRGLGMSWGAGNEHGTSAPQSSHAVPSVRNEPGVNDSGPYQAILEEQGLPSQPHVCWLKRCFKKYPKVTACLATLITAGVGCGTYCIYAYTSWFHR